MDSYQKALQEASEFIKEHDHFLVISHVNPDGDAIGSSMAVAHLLTNLGKKYVVANAGAVPRRFSFISGIDQLMDFSMQEPNSTFSSVIALDAADEQRMGSTVQYMDEGRAILNIDHHPTNTMFGNVNVILASAASTTEILYDLIEHYFPEHMDFKIAEALYTGLMTDTGGFRYSNTTQSVLNKAAALLSYEIKPHIIAEHALETISVSYLGLLQVVLPSLHFSFDYKVASLTVTLEDLKRAQASKDDIDGLVSYPRNIEGVEVGILFKQVSATEVKVSLRSKSEVDVAKIAQSHGGGGHAKASGFTFEGSLEEAQKLLEKDLGSILGERK